MIQSLDHTILKLDKQRCTKDIEDGFFVLKFMKIDSIQEVTIRKLSSGTSNHVKFLNLLQVMKMELHPLVLPSTIFTQVLSIIVLFAGT